MCVAANTAGSGPFRLYWVRVKPDKKKKTQH